MLRPYMVILHRREFMDPDNPTALILLNMGGPDAPEAVEPFLYNLFSDRELIQLPLGSVLQKPFARLIAHFRSKRVRLNYRLIGGKSPLLQWTMRQAEGIAIGKFQGVIRANTPCGTRMVLQSLSGSSDGAVSPWLFEPGKNAPTPDRSGASISTTSVEPAGATPDTGTVTSVSSCGSKSSVALPISVRLSYVKSPSRVYRVTGIDGVVSRITSTPNVTSSTSKSSVMSKSLSVKARKNWLSVVEIPPSGLHATVFGLSMSKDSECVIVTTSNGCGGNGWETVRARVAPAT